MHSLRVALSVGRTVLLVAAWVVTGLLWRIRTAGGRREQDRRGIRNTSAPGTSSPEVIVVGAGQAGLAIGYYLSGAGVPFLILEAGSEVGDSWRGRWDSLRLFSPARYSSVPGLAFPGPPDRFPTKDEVADYLRLYAETFDLPVRLNSEVVSVTRTDGSYLVETADDRYRAQQVIVAVGAFQVPFVPPIAEGLDSEVFQVHSAHFRNPDQIPTGDVLVVGAANSGCQLAEELAAARSVYLSAGTVVPMLPRRVLRKDVFWWTDVLGVFRVPRDSWVGRRASKKDFVVATSARRLAR